MIYKPSPTKNRYVTILFCIVTAMLPILFLGCQEVTEPSRSPYLDGVSGSLPQAQSALDLSIEAGPLLTLMNEYLEPIVPPRPAGYMKIPEGVPITFCWTAKRAPDGGAIKAYRYGWDIFGPGQPERWDVDFTAYDGSKICSPPRTFDSKEFHLFTVEVIDDADVSSRVTILIDIVLGPSSFDVMPGSCKNPLSTQRKGQIRTAIPGRIGLDVSEIDVSSLYLWIDGNVVEPLGTKVRDITSPLINRPPCDCPPAGRDGIDDLMILFAAADITRAMGPVVRGETRELSIRGSLLDGFDFALSDCVVIVGNPRMGDDPALLQRDAVLVALDKAYKGKDFQKISVLLDSDFTFFFSDSDIQKGYVDVSQWGREEELAATAKLFNADSPAGEHITGSIDDRFGVPAASEGATWGRVKAAFFDGVAGGQTSISLLLIFPQGEEYWTTVMPPDPDRYPGEVWYQKSAMYYLTVQAEDMTFYTEPLLNASFVVRFSETKDHWQLVQWRDGI